MILRGEGTKLNTKRLILFFLIAIAAVALSACSRAPIANSWHGLSADSNYAYVSGGSFIYAVDLKTGREAWRYPAEANSKLTFYATPVLTADGQLLIGSAGTTHSFTSLDPATGAEKWAFSGAKGVWLAPPLVLKGTIYAPNTDGYLYFLDTTGKQVSDPLELGGALWSAPVTDGTNLYVASLDHHLHVIDISSRAITQSINLGGAVPSSPALAESGAYIGSFASTLEWVKPDGSHKILADAGNWIWGSPVVDGETLYFADLDGKITSLNITSGSRNWESSQLNDPIVAGLLVSADQIYAGTEKGNLIALDAKGQTIWERSVGGAIYSSPVAAGDLILVAPFQVENALVAYDAQGKQAWTFKPVK